MRYLVFLTIISALMFISSETFAWRQGEPVTPYGASCARCGRYGTGKSMMNPEDAEKAIKHYYNKKGLKVKIENIKGQFIKARVKYKGRVVDVIIFDRRTGRIRSTY